MSHDETLAGILLQLASDPETYFVVRYREDGEWVLTVDHTIPLSADQFAALHRIGVKGVPETPPVYWGGLLSMTPVRSMEDLAGVEPIEDGE